MTVVIIFSTVELLITPSILTKWRFGSGWFRHATFDWTQLGSGLCSCSDVHSEWT